MSRKILSCSLIALSVAACSSNDPRRASGDFDYAELKEAQQLSIPDNLSKPKEQNEFYIVEESKVRGPIGNQVDVRAPSLVLPIAASSRTVATTTEAVIWYDKVLEDKDLKFFIYQAIEKALVDENIGLNPIGDDGLSFETDWLHKEKEDGWLFKDVVLSESIKFRFDLLTKPHGRSVGIKASLIDYMRTDEQGGSKTIDPIDRARAEMAVLNKITAQVDFEYRKQQRENRLLKATQKLVSLSSNDKGEAAYQVEMPADLLWQNLPIFFERHNFTITDLNESTQVYFVKFTKPDISLWDSIWGDGAPVVEIENGKYRFELSEKSAEESLVTIYNDKDEALSEATLQEIFAVMDAGLSFRE